MICETEGCAASCYEYPVCWIPKTLTRCFLCETGYYYDNALLAAHGIKPGFSDGDIEELEVQLMADCIYIIISKDPESEAEDANIDISLPIKFKVCYRCGGSGKHTNPAIDENGITSFKIAE